MSRPTPAQAALGVDIPQQATVSSWLKLLTQSRPKEKPQGSILPRITGRPFLEVPQLVILWAPILCGTHIMIMYRLLVTLRHLEVGQALRWNNSQEMWPYAQLTLTRTGILDWFNSKFIKQSFLDNLLNNKSFLFLNCFLINCATR